MTSTKEDTLAAAKTLAEALLNVQKNVPPLEKDGTNPHFKNDYVTLDNLISTVLPLLHAEGVLLMQPLSLSQSSDGPVPVLETRFVHTSSGEERVFIVPLVLDKQTSQGLGSAVTYTRRYALASALGLVSETDDDGNVASGKKKPTKEADLKKQVWAIAKERLEKPRPTAAEVAKLFKVKQADLQEEETLQEILAAALDL